MQKTRHGDPDKPPGCDNEVEDRPTKGSDRSYYYDDSHGYEDFDPEAEDETVDEEGD